MKDEALNAITARHIAKAISHLDEVKTPRCAIDAVRREFWFLKDDIKDIVNQGETPDAEKKTNR